MTAVRRWFLPSFLIRNGLARAVWPSRMRFNMHTLDKKAIFISTVGHILLLLAVFVIGFSKPVRRSYPRVLTATFVDRSPDAGSGEKRVEVAPRPVEVPPPVESKPIPSKIPIPQKPEPKKPEAKPQEKTKTPQPSPPTTISKDPQPATSAGQSSGGQQGPAVSGIAKVDAPNFAFPHYLALIQVRIENQWRPPYSGGGQYLATVHFIIARSGNVLSSEIEKSSGNFAFDQAALRAVQTASPLPPLPDGSGLETLGVHFDFVATW